MKKLVLVILITVVIATPCLAQELEPEGIFSIEGTLWQEFPISVQIFPFPWIFYNSDYYFAFYGGELYEGYKYDLRPSRYYNVFYMDMPMFSIFFTYFPTSTHQMTGCIGEYFGVMQPTIGMGMLTVFGCTIYYTPAIGLALLIKIDNNWTPSEIPPEPVLSSISPNYGVQGTTLTDVTITGVHTNFESIFPVKVIFTPSYGLTVSNINVISDTEIEFDLEIAVDTPQGNRDVWVEYGKETIVGSNFFGVSPKTN